MGKKIESNKNELGRGKNRMSFFFFPIFFFFQFLFTHIQRTLLKIKRLFSWNRRLLIKTIDFYAIQKAFIPDQTTFYSLLSFSSTILAYATCSQCIITPSSLYLRDPLYIKGGQKSPFFMNTISLYYIPFQYNLGIIFSKFEVSSINDGSHRGK